VSKNILKALPELIDAGILSSEKAIGNQAVTMSNNLASLETDSS
jgi:hypothetical protein